MSYQYKVLESVLKEIIKDDSTENIFDQVDCLTTDECRKLKELLFVAIDAADDKILNMGEY